MIKPTQSFKTCLSNKLISTKPLLNVTLGKGLPFAKNSFGFFKSLATTKKTPEDSFDHMSFYVNWLYANKPSKIKHEREILFQQKDVIESSLTSQGIPFYKCDAYKAVITSVNKIHPFIENKFPSLNTQEQRTLQAAIFEDPPSQSNATNTLIQAESILNQNQVSGEPADQLHNYIQTIEQFLFTHYDYNAWLNKNTHKEIKKERNALFLTRDYLIRNISHNDFSGKKALVSSILERLQKSLRSKHPICYNYPLPKQQHKYLAWKIMYYKEPIKNQDALLLLKGIQTSLQSKHLPNSDLNEFAILFSSLAESTNNTISQLASKLLDQYNLQPLQHVKGSDTFSC